MQFSKYQGIGNDFLVVDLRNGDLTPSPQDPQIVQSLCDRRFGVGGDGVLALLPAQTEGAAARMRVLNADGSEAEMCGNGIRCVAKYLFEKDPALRKPEIVIDTGAGPLSCRVSVVDDSVESVTVDMGQPRLNRAEIPMVVGDDYPAGDERVLETPIELLDKSFPITAVSMGNPHAITFVEATGAALRDMAVQYGPTLENHPWFPQRTNAEFAAVHSPTHIELVVWERGSGLTLACGTGACATAVAACLTGRAKPGTAIKVGLLGGDLTITVAEDYSTVLMSGPAAHVFDGEKNL
jgi:diaminopimelate epimerase